MLARRPLSQTMLTRAVRTFHGIKCVGPEDQIGLKIQAYKRTMIDDEYLEFTEQFMELFPDLEPRRWIEIRIALL